MLKSISSYFYQKNNEEKPNLDDKYIHKLSEIKYALNLCDQNSEFINKKPYATNFLTTPIFKFLSVNYKMLEVRTDFLFASQNIDFYIKINDINSSCKIVFDEELEEEYKKLIRNNCELKKYFK